MRRHAAALALFVALVTARDAAAQLVPRDGSAAIAVRSHRVVATVEDGLARTTVRQTFVNQHGRPLEAVYVFPVPKDAALIGIALESGGERHAGVLAERAVARRAYDEIVRGRRDPALVEQIGAELFRLSVFPVVPGEETVVELSWLEQVPLVRGELRYVVPLATGAGEAARTERDFTATVTVRSSAPLVGVTASRDDAQVVRASEHESVVSCEASGATLDADLVVTARVATTRPRLDVRTFRRSADEDAYFVAVVTPPDALVGRVVPRDVILVIDTSGSMNGGKLAQAQASALWLLERLRPEDRVGVVRFSSDVQAFAPEPVAATAANVERLAAFVRGFEPAGGTALGDALAAVAKLEPASGRARTVVLLTDGRPTIGETDSAAIVRAGRAAGERGLRVFAFGVGADVDSALLHGIALAGRGRAETFRPSGEIETRLTAFLARTASPAVSELELVVEGAGAYDVLPRPLPDAYLGEQLTLTGRLRGAGTVAFAALATIGDERKGLRTTVELPADAGGADHVPFLFARQKLAFLEDALRLRRGLADDAYYAALDRGAHATGDEITREIVALSLRHGVQCAYTSFLAMPPEERERLGPRLADELDFAESEDDPDFNSDSPFDSKAFHDVIGIGGGAGGKFGSRRGGRRASGALSYAPRRASPSWLASCAPEDVGDVAANALALLALLGEGSTTTAGEHRDEVGVLVAWLRDHAAEATSPSERALVAVALGEAYRAVRSPLLREAADEALQRMIDALESAWPAPGAGLAWAAWALAVARDAQLPLDPAVLDDAAAWVESLAALPLGEAATDHACVAPATRAAELLLARVLVADARGDDVTQLEGLERLAAVVDAARERLAGAAACDVRYWAFGTLALFRIGGSPWRAWEVALKGAVVERQVREGDLAGSWDPLGPCGAADRVMASASMALAVVTYYRYALLLPTR